MGNRERAFLVMAKQLCHSLPRKAHLAPSLLYFPRRLKTELFKWAFYSSDWFWLYFSIHKIKSPDTLTHALTESSRDLRNGNS